MTVEPGQIWMDVRDSSKHDSPTLMIVEKAENGIIALRVIQCSRACYVGKKVFLFPTAFLNPRHYQRGEDKVESVAVTDG